MALHAAELEKSSDYMIDVSLCQRRMLHRGAFLLGQSGAVFRVAESRWAGVTQCGVQMNVLLCRSLNFRGSTQSCGIETVENGNSRLR